MKAIILLYLFLLAQQLYAGTDLPSQSVTSGQETEKAVLNNATCYLACMEEMELDTVMSDTSYSAWPTYVLETNTNTTDCQTISRFLECHRGCVINVTTSELETICESQCSLMCSECSLGLQACGEFGCAETEYCNVTECGFWCNLLHHTNFNMCSNESNLPSSPINAPNLEVYQGSGQFGLYEVDLMKSAPNTSATRPTSFIFRVEDTSTHNKYYIWQKIPTDVLSLVKYSGQDLSISFAAVTRCGRSQYSPSVNLTCATITSTTPPSKIYNISVVFYSWDSASSLLHVDLSWDPPAVVNGVLRGYNVSIGTRPLEELEEPVGDFHITDITPSASPNSSSSLSAMLSFSGTQCIYIQMRAWNDVGPGQWSEELLVVTSVNKEEFESYCYWDVPPSRLHLVWYDLETTQCGRSDFITQVEIHRLLLDTSGSVNQELSVISQIAFDFVERIFDDLDATQNYGLIFVANFAEPAVNTHTLGSCNITAAIAPPTTTSFPMSTLLPSPLLSPSPRLLFTTTHYISLPTSIAPTPSLSPVNSNPNPSLHSPLSHQTSSLSIIAPSAPFSSSYQLMESHITSVLPTAHHTFLSSLTTPLSMPSSSLHFYTRWSGTPTSTGMPTAPPSKIHNVSVISYSWDSAASLLHVELSWDPPAVVNGVLRGYNVSIGIHPLEELEEPVGDFHITDITPSASPNSSASLSATLNFPDTQCLYIQIRAWNDIRQGQWSDELLVVTSVNQEMFESFCYWNDPPSRLHLIWYDLETTQCGRNDFITQVEIHQLLLDTSGSVNQELGVITQKAFDYVERSFGDLDATQSYGLLFVANFAEPAVNTHTLGSCNVTAAITPPTMPKSSAFSVTTALEPLPTNFATSMPTAPPSKIHNVSVTSYSWDSAASLLHVDLSWDPPAVVNGVLRGYNVSIGTRPLEELEEPVGDFHITDSQNISVSFSATLNFPDTQCLYIQVRAWNDIGQGQWSGELLVVTTVNQEMFESYCYWDDPPMRLHLVWYDLETAQCGRSDFITQVEIHRLLLDTSGSVNQELSVISQIAFDFVERSFDDLDATQNYELIFVANFVEPSVNIHTLGSCNVQAAISPPTTTSFPTSTLLPLPISLPSPPSLFTSTHYISSHISMASARPLLPSPVTSDSSHQRSSLLTIASSTSFSLYSSYTLIPSPTTNIPPTILLSSLAAPLTLPSLSYTPPSGTQTRPTPTGMPSASPSKIHNVSVTSYSWDSASSLLHVDLSWNPPAVVNGVLRGYNVSIGTRPLEDLEEPVGDFHITDITPSASPKSSASLSATFNFTGTQCLYVQMRAWNDFEPGQWSNYLLVVTSVNQERFESCCYWDDPPLRLHLVWYDLETTQCGRSDFITQVEIHQLLLETSGSVNQELGVINQKALDHVQRHWDDLISTKNYGFVLVANFAEPAVSTHILGSCNVSAVIAPPTATFFPTSTLLPSPSVATTIFSPSTSTFFPTLSNSQVSSSPVTTQLLSSIPKDIFEGTETLPGYVFGIIGGGIVAAATAVVITVTVLIVCKLHKRKRQLQRITEDFGIDPMFLSGPKKPQYKSEKHTPLQTDEWEISPQQVIVGECLGEGAFGEVYKGTVTGPLSNPKLQRLMKSNICITVAIKLLKSSTKGSERSDFLKEIETMKKVAEGQNPHVVGLVGCVTTQEPLSLITEFVEYGDLLSYLRTSRKQATQGLDRLLNNSDNPYYKLGRITAENLICFAYQIASGMEFLSSLGVVHRDLACRNVLVGEGKVLKITDFGMAREIDEVYMQKSKGRVPLKWMAIESIVEREFTTASDVWAYGITLWEITTMGGYPYPCIMCEDLLQQLQKGYRMEKPDNCVPEVYQIMLECWSRHPKKRPPFAEIKAKFDTMLMAGRKDAYIDLQFDLDSPYYTMDPEAPSLLSSSPRTNHLSVDTEPLLKTSLSQGSSSPRASPALSCRISIRKAISSLSRSPSPSPAHEKPWRPSSMILAKREHRENKYITEPLSGATEGGPEVAPFELRTRLSEEGSSGRSNASPFSLPVDITVTENL